MSRKAKRSAPIIKIKELKKAKPAPGRYRHGKEKEKPAR